MNPNANDKPSTPPGKVSGVAATHSLVQNNFSDEPEADIPTPLDRRTVLSFEPSESRGLRTMGERMPLRHWGLNE